MKEIASLEEQQENDTKARANAMSDKMTRAVFANIPTTALMSKSTSAGNEHTPKTTSNWMNNIGLAPKNRASASQDNMGNEHAPKGSSNWMMNIGLVPKERVSASRDNLAEIHTNSQNGSSEEAKKLAAGSSATNSNWMMNLGLAPKKTASASQDNLGERRATLQNGSSEEAKKLAAAALSAVKDVTSATAAAASGRGKVEITEVRDFAGEEIQVRKLVDSDSKEAVERAAKMTSGPPSALDNVLEQIKKKQKLSVLDKTKKDWGEFKGENKGMEDELDAYKKSTNQYLDKVSFLQRADLREFERERDARLALQSKRRADMQED